MYKESLLRNFIAVLLILATNWEQPKCSKIAECLNKLQKNASKRKIATIKIHVYTTIIDLNQI